MQIADYIAIGVLIACLLAMGVMFLLDVTHNRGGGSNDPVPF